MTTWQEADLSDFISKIESGGRPRGGVSEDSGEVPSLGGENIRLSGGMIYDSVKKVPTTFFTGLKKGVLKSQDVLINKDGANTGKVGLYRGEFSIASINEHLFLLRGNPDKLKQRFLYYLLLSPYGQQVIRSKISGSAQPGLKRDFIKDFPVSIPSQLQEQSIIADVIETVDQAITQTETLIAKYQRIKTGLMQDLLMQGIDENGNLRDPATHEFKEVEGYGRIPVEWGTGYLNEVIDSFRPIVYGILMPGYGYENGIPVIKVKDIFNGKVDSSDLLLTDPKIDQLYKRSRLQTGDLLFTIRGTVGRMAFVPAELDGANITQDTARICVTKAYPLFIRYYLDSFRAKTFIELHTLGQAVKGINLGDVRKIPIALPPKVEQERIANALLVCDDMIKNELTNVSKLNKLKTGLMQDLLTGKVSVAPLLENNRN